MSIIEKENKKDYNYNDIVREAEFIFNENDKNEITENSTLDQIKKYSKDKSEIEVNNNEIKDKNNEKEVNKEEVSSMKNNSFNSEKKGEFNNSNELNNDNDLNNLEKIHDSKEENFFIKKVDYDFDDSIESNTFIYKENKTNNINLEKLVSYDKPHHIKFNTNSNNEINDNKNNLLKDIMYSELPFFMLKENTNNFKNIEEIDEVILNDQIKFNLDPVNKLDKNIKKNLIYSIKKYDKADNYTKKYLYNLSPCYESQYFSNIFFDILYYRRARNDSDSFFKCFMFSYFEKCIIYKNIIRIKIVIEEILNNIIKTFSYKNIQVNQNETLFILLIILEYLEKDDIINSIKFLNRAFCSNDNFCNTLVKYMKIKLSNFIKEYYQFLNSDEIINNNIISKKYYNTQKEFNYYIYSKEKILLMQSEPDLFIYYITPFVFKIDLRIYSIESFGEKNLTLSNIPFENKFKIDLIYVNKKYLIAYNDTYYANNSEFFNYDIKNDDIEDKLIITDMGDEEIISIKQINYDDIIEICDSNFKCDKCNKKTNQIILKKICPNSKICQNCLKINIDKVLLNRSQNIKKDGYENIEYYSRNIQLTDNNEINMLFLTIIEFKFLYGEKSTFLSELLDLLNSICSSCGNSVEYELLIQMKCGCKICKNCLANIIINYTDNKIILNSNEKILLLQKKESPKCKCGDLLDIDFIISKIYTEEELKEYKEKALERLKNNKKICLKCKKEFDLNEENTININNDESNKKNENNKNDKENKNKNDNKNKNKNDKENKNKNEKENKNKNEKENKNKNDKENKNKNEKENKNSIQYYNINIEDTIDIEEKPIEDYENHVICIECFNKINNNFKRNNNFYQMDCKICDKKHTVTIEIKQNPNKKNNKDHCTCYIF